MSIFSPIKYSLSNILIVKLLLEYSCGAKIKCITLFNYYNYTTLTWIDEVFELDTGQEFFFGCWGEFAICCPLTGLFLTACKGTNGELCVWTRQEPVAPCVGDGPRPWDRQFVRGGVWKFWCCWKILRLLLQSIMLIFFIHSLLKYHNDLFKESKFNILYIKF